MENVNEKNRIIAEFMGFEYNRFAPLANGETLQILSVNDLQYHTSWEWLMPVVEKIEGMGWFHVIGKMISNEQRSHFINYYTGEEIAGTRTDTKLSAIYDSVVNFIKWYNQNK